MGVPSNGFHLVEWFILKVPSYFESACGTFFEYIALFLFPFMMTIAGSSHIADWLVWGACQQLAWYPEWSRWSKPFSRFLRAGSYRQAMQDLTSLKGYHTGTR